MAGKAGLSMTIARAREHRRRRPARALGSAACAVSLLLLSGAGARAQQTEFCVTCQGPDATYRCTFDDAGASPAQQGLQLHCISTLAREGGHQSCAIGRAAKAPCAGTLKVLALPGASPGTVPTAPVQATADPGGPAPAEPAPGPPAQTTAVEPPQADVEMQGVRQAPPAPMAEGQAPATVKRTWSDTSGPSGQPIEKAEAPGQTSDGAAKSPVETADEQPASNDLLKPLNSAGKAVTNAAKTTGEALGKAGDAVGSAAKKSWKCLTSLFGDC